MYLLGWYFLKLLLLSQICVIHFSRYPRRREYNYSKFGSTLILHTIFELYHAKTIYMISWMPNQVEKFVVLSGTGTILPWFLSIKLFTLSVHHCILNTSVIESYVLVTRRSSSSFFFFLFFLLKIFSINSIAFSLLDHSLTLYVILNSSGNLILGWQWSVYFLIDYFHR